MANTVPINDRLGPGGLENVAILSTDANGNTVLIDNAAGVIPTLGANVITVGAGGMYSTLQAAIDYLETLTQFEAVTGIGTTPTVTAWSQGSDQLTVTGLGGQVGLGRDGYWITHATLAGRLYPVEATLGIGGTPLVSAMRRIEANFAGSEALSFYAPVMHTILLLPGESLSENVTFSIPVCVEIVSIGDAVWDGTISCTTDVTHGIIRLNGVSSQTATKFLNVFGLATKNAVAVEIINCKQRGINDGWMSPNACLGSLKVIGGEAKQTPGIGLGHFIVLNDVQGDVIVDGIRVEVDAQNVAGADFRLFDNESTTTRRKTVASRVILDVYDPNGLMGKCAIFGSARGASFATDCQINYYSPVASTTELAIAYDDMSAAVNGFGVCVVAGCDIASPPLHTGGKYAFKANKVGSTNDAVVNNCGALLSSKPSAGTLSVLSQGIGGAATNGAQTATLTNLPAAATAGNPNQWRKITLDDGSIGYIPVWK